MKRTIILLLDSLGIGASADADKFGDVGANTLGAIAKACAAGSANNDKRQGPLNLPNLSALGLGKACELSSGYFPEGLMLDAAINAAYGYGKEISSGKDTPSGHWEIAGVPVLFEWGYFKDKQNSFPKALTDKILARAGLSDYLGNCHSSGTEILDKLGEQHMQTGLPIFYTSADSVFQIACHEETFGLERLLELCEIAREELEGYNIGRVIARPFVGKGAGKFVRTGNRHDISLPPPATTVLQKLVEEKQGDVISIGKIADIYADCGITKKIKASGLEQLTDATIKAIKEAGDNSLVFTNFVDFDSHYGHRRDVAGYAAALEYFDRRLPEILANITPDDLLIITADHGCDPTWQGSDHTREHIPILMQHRALLAGTIGGRETFADIGQTIATYFQLTPMPYGKSVL